jgi:alpha/beta superfamily hydrolase
MAVIFSHSKESGSNGAKIQLLSNIAQQLDFETHSIDYTQCKDVSERVKILEGFIKKNPSQKHILVGSSMGGYVSTVVAQHFATEGLFLMCPALYLSNYPVQRYRPITNNIEIIHGWQDEVVPYQNSIQFGQETKATLYLIADNHRLSEQRIFLGETFRQFLNVLKQTFRAKNLSI